MYYAIAAARGGVKVLDFARGVFHNYDVAHDSTTDIHMTSNSLCR